jgi:hypothetical protein
MTTTIISEGKGKSMNQIATATKTYGPDRPYTRQDAVGDGFLMDISERYPDIAKAHPGKELYVTDRVWEIIEKSADNPKTASSREGILWDIIGMSRCSINENKDQFRVGINGIEGQTEFPLKTALIWDENSNAGAVILLPAEDTHDRPILF